MYQNFFHFLPNLSVTDYFSREHSLLLLLFFAAPHFSIYPFSLFLWEKKRYCLVYLYFCFDYGYCSADGDLIFVKTSKKIIKINKINKDKTGIFPGFKFEFLIYINESNFFLFLSFVGPKTVSWKINNLSKIAKTLVDAIK